MKIDGSEIMSSNFPNEDDDDETSLIEFQTEK